MSDTNFIKETTLNGALEIQRPTFADGRGFFRESIRINDLNQVLKTPFQVVQANHARSTKGALRGIHIAPWNKLIYVTRGKVQSVIVDLVKDSPTFGKHQSFIIGDDNKTSVFIPKGFGNSYNVLSEEADYTYLTDAEWAPGLEFGIAWNDPTLAIQWELDGEPNLSEKDKQNPTFKEKFEV